MSEKAIAKARKEGGKKGQDILGLSETGGMVYFTLVLKDTTPDLIDEALAGLNAPIDEAAEERKGGAGKLGKFLLSADEKVLRIVFEVPAELAAEKELTAKDWAAGVLKDSSKPIDVKEVSATLITGEVHTDADAGVYAEKLRDELSGHSFNFLRTKGLVPPEDDDDYIPDPEAAGIGSW